MQLDAAVRESRTRDSPQVFFARVREAFDRAVERAGEIVEDNYVIAGCTVRLRFAGPTLVPAIRPALAHHAVAVHPVAAALTVYLWDSASTGVFPPPPPWGQEDYIDRGAIRGYNTDHIRTAYFLGPGVLSLLDLESNQALYWLRDARQHPVYMTGSPLLTLLHWWMEKHDRQIVHAGAVGLPEGGVLLIGKGGSGKSTTTLACLHSPLSYLADDYVILNRESPYVVYSLYNSGKLNAASQGLLPDVAALAAGASLDFMGKSLFFVHEHMPDKLIREFPLAAFLLPQVKGGVRTRLRPVSGQVVRQALVPSTIHQLTGAGAEAIKALEELANSAPGFALELGTDMEGIPAAILRLLERG